MSTVAVVGLGYVGLPLVVEFGKLGRAIGFDIGAGTPLATGRKTAAATTAKA